MKTFNTIMNSCNRGCSYCYLGKDMPEDRAAFERSIAYLTKMFQPETISTLVNGGFDQARLFVMAKAYPGIQIYIGHDQLREPGMLDYFKQDVFATSKFFISRFMLEKEADLEWLRLEDRVTLVHVLGTHAQNGSIVAANVTMSKIALHYVLFEFPYSIKEYTPAVLSFAHLMRHNPKKIINFDLCYRKATGRLTVWEGVDPSLEIHPDGKIRFCDYTGEMYDPTKMSREEIIEAGKICNKCPYLKP